jgi:hypothetical protein
MVRIEESEKMESVSGHVCGNKTNLEESAGGPFDHPQIAHPMVFPSEARGCVKTQMARHTVHTHTHTHTHTHRTKGESEAEKSC